MMFHELSGFPVADQALMHIERGLWWKNEWKPWVAKEIGQAISQLDLDQPWEELAKDPVKEALADSLFSSVLSCFGPELKPENVKTLNTARFGADYATQNVAAHVFTGNHLSVSAKLFPLDSQGKLCKGPVTSHHMPTFASVSEDKPAIGDISTIKFKENFEGFFLSLVTPKEHVWQKKLEVIKAKPYTTQMVGPEGAKTAFKSIASPCVSNFQVLILRPDCQENCIMCTVPRGNGDIPAFYKAQVSEVLDILVNDAAAKGIAFQQTFTGGSLSTGDGGFSTAHAWGMNLLAEKIFKAQEKVGHKIPVHLQLEMILPKDKSTWHNIIGTLSKYQKMGWKISLAINMEVIQDPWKPLFLQGNIKSTTSVEDHLQFAKLLSESTQDQIQINSLVMFGMKPKVMDWEQYLTADLISLAQLVSAGIKPDYQPAKAEVGTKFEAYPPPNPVFLMVQDAALKYLIKQANLPWAPGCVGGCNACDQSHETNALVNIAGKMKLELADIYAPIIDKIGSGYKEAYEIITGKNKGY